MSSTIKRNKYEIDMCNGTIMDKLISFSLPLMLSGILQLMFNAVDIIVIGRFSGSQSLAAVGSTTALINMFTNLFIGISLGANVLSARFYAAGKDKEMSETVHTAITLALISGIIMVFVGLIFAKPVLELMDTPGVLWPKFESEEVALNLAYTGTIKSDVIDEVEIAYNLVKFLIEKYKDNLIGRYSLNPNIIDKISTNAELEENEKIVEIMNYIGEKRGAVAKGNDIDLDKVSRIILDDFRSGNLGRITLEMAE